MQPNNDIKNDHILRTPIWMFAVRILQAIVSIAIVGLSAAISEGKTTALAFTSLPEACNLCIAVVCLSGLRYHFSAANMLHRLFSPGSS